jgi:hypothetical protein
MGKTGLSPVRVYLQVMVFSLIEPWGTSAASQQVGVRNSMRARTLAAASLEHSMP